MTLDYQTVQLIVGGFSALTFIVCAALLNMYINRTLLWKVSILLGMAGMGLGGVLIFIDGGHLYWPAAWVIGVFLMMCGVFATGYLETDPHTTTSLRGAAVRTLAFCVAGFAFLAIPLGIWFYSSNQTTNAAFVSMFQLVEAVRQNNDLNNQRYNELVQEFIKQRQEWHYRDSVNAARNLVLLKGQQLIIKGQSKVVEKVVEKVDNLPPTRSYRVAPAPSQPDNGPVYVPAKSKKVSMIESKPINIDLDSLMNARLRTDWLAGAHLP